MIYIATLCRPWLQFLGESASSGVINCLNKACTLKPLITMTCNFVLAQPSMTSKQFHLHNFTHKAWVILWCGFQALSKGAAHWNCLAMTILSRCHILDKSTMVKFTPGPYGQKANFLSSYHMPPPPHSVAKVLCPLFLPSS